MDAVVDYFAYVVFLPSAGLWPVTVVGGRGLSGCTPKQRTRFLQLHLEATHFADLVCWRLRPGAQQSGAGVHQIRQSLGGGNGGTTTNT